MTMYFILEIQRRIFSGDAIYGPSDIRAQRYQKRKMNKSARKSKKPLTKMQQGIFSKILKRGENEGLIDYWKRQRTLLNFPNKLWLIEECRLKESKLETLIRDHEDSDHRREQIAKVEKQFREMQKLSKSINHKSSY